jgi:hypothetical protein
MQAGRSAWSDPVAGPRDWTMASPIQVSNQFSTPSSPQTFSA